jgi:hypothetical protein
MGDEMNFKESELLLKTYRKLQDATAVTIRINQNQVVDIVVNDLLKKYLHCKKGGLSEADAFEAVLKYYLTDAEFEQLTNPTQPDN